MEVLRLLTEGQVSFGHRSVSDTEVRCKSSSSFSQPPDIRKTFAVLTSILLLSASPASAMPRIQREIPIWERSLEDVVPYPCNFAGELLSTHSATAHNLTLDVLKLLNITSDMSHKYAVEMINKTLSRSCHQHSLGDLVTHNREDISKTADRKLAMEEMYRVLSESTAHVIKMLKDTTNTESATDCRHESGMKYEPDQNDVLQALIKSLLHTMCYTLKLKDLLGLSLQFVHPSTETLNRIAAMRPDCSIRQVGDCLIINSTEEFLTHYRDYYLSVYNELKQSNH